MFQRRPITFTPQEIWDYHQDIESVAEAIEWHLINANWPKHHPKNRFGACTFLPLCTRGDLTSYYTRPLHKLNPELAD